MTKRHYITIFLAVIAATLILGGCLMAAFYNRHYLDREGVNLGAFKPTASIKFEANDNFLISQVISATGNNLGKIIMPVNVDQTTVLDLSVTSTDNRQILHQQTITLQPDSQEPVQYVSWEFAALSNSAGQDYLINIKKQNNGIITFYAVPPERYDGGELSINGSLLDSQRVIVDWQYYTNNAFQAALERFGFMKPGILNAKLTFIIIITALFFLNWLVVGLIAKLTLDALPDKKI